MVPMPESLRKDKLCAILLINSTLTPFERFFMISRHYKNKIALRCASFEFGEKIDSLDGFQESDQACYHVMYGKDIDPWFERFMDLMRENEELQEQNGKVQRMDEKDSYICDLSSNDLPNNLLLLLDSFTKLNPAFA